VWILVISAIVRALFQGRSAPRREAAGDAGADVIRDAGERWSPAIKRAATVQALLDRGEFDAAAKSGRAWIREIDGGQELCESVAAGCLASILEALIQKLPKHLDIVTSFGEALLSTLNAKPSGGRSAKLRTLHALAIAADSVGDAATSRARFEAAVEVAESMHNLDPSDRAYFLFRHASSCRACGALDEAARQLQRALILLDETTDHRPLRIDTLMLTGTVRFEQGRIPEAREALERACDAVAASPELEDRFWIGTGMRWGQVLLAQNDTAAVAALLRTAEVEERVHGENSTALISTLYYLSKAHLAQGSLPDAVAALERARAIHDRAVGRHTLSLREILRSLSRVKFDQGEREEARRILAELVKAEEQTDPPNDAGMAADLVDLAAICRALGDIRAERENLERALAAAERASGPESPNLIPILERLGFAVWNSPDWAGARGINQRLATIERGQLGSDHPRLASTLLNQAIVTARCGDHEGARGLLTETMSILEATPFRPPGIVDRIVVHVEELQRHPVHGGGYRNLLPRARALRSEDTGGLPVAQA
jgi:tetratricopeptide (TPR) repeat protein